MNALTLLKELALVDNRRKFPRFPEHARVIDKYSDKTANGLTKCIIDFIRFNGGQAERISVTGRYIDNSIIVTNYLGNKKRIGSGQWIKPSMQSGTADISATIAGRSIKIEVKCNITKDKQRPAQKEYQKQIEAAGGIYLLISSFDDFFEWYNSNFKA
jgi:hypothetical protein